MSAGGVNVPSRKDLIEMEKPSLAEIAAMSFPASKVVLNHFYGPAEVEPEEGEREYEVQVLYSWRKTDSKTYRVFASPAEEAAEAAEDAFEQDGSITSDCEFEDIGEVVVVK